MNHVCLKPHLSIFLRTTRNYNSIRSLHRAMSTEADIPTKEPVASFYDLKAQVKGKTVDFADFKGKPVLIINVASQCGFTPQYNGLEELYKKYHPLGLEVIGFPCNQFGGQEPGSDDEIVESCQLNHGVTFPLAKKADVNGPEEQPVYSFLKNAAPGIFGLTRIKWNFEKFLIDKEGKTVTRFPSTTTPAALDAEIQKLL